LLLKKLAMANLLFHRFFVLMQPMPFDSVPLELFPAIRLPYRL
jgi:hypothetical protein